MAIDAYCRRHQINEAHHFHHFKSIINSVDGAYLDHMKKKADTEGGTS